MQKPRKPSIPYDKLWKGIVTDYFEDFLAMFLSDLHKEVDFSVPFEFLEQELKAVLIGKTLKKVDKLVRVKMKDGTENWVFVHIEFENSHDPIIKERMFDYYVRIREKYGKNITAIVIYTGQNAPKSASIYKIDTFGTIVSCEFNTYEIFKQKEQDLLANPNPFAIVVLANLYVLQTQGNDENRLLLKQKIYEIARMRNYPINKTDKLVVFLFELMKLPTDLEGKFNTYISKPQKPTATMYITQTSVDIADAIAKENFGKTFTEMNASIDSKDSTIVNTMVRLFVQLKMSVEEIAEFMQIDTKTVHTTLKKHKLIKK